MSPKDALTKTVARSPNSRKPSTRTGYVAALFFTAAGLGLIFWSVGQGVMITVNVHDHATETSIATLVLEGVAGMLTTVFGFAMLVQVTPSVDTEAACAWALPEQRTFDDEPPASRTG